MTTLRGRVRAVSTHATESTGTDWALGATAPGAAADAVALHRLDIEWTPIAAATTVAAALGLASDGSRDGVTYALDEQDWWFRAVIPPAQETAGERWLRCDGLATLADLWLDGQHLLSSSTMFAAQDVRLPSDDRAHELVMRFRALGAELSQKRPRPRWRVPMLQQQQLRWFRSTLLGRTAGWSPAWPAVGPWRPLRVERRTGFDVADLQLHCSADGALRVGLGLRSIDGAQLSNARLLVDAGRGVSRHDIQLGPSDGSVAWSSLRLSGVEPWWPHTHGTPRCYDAAIEVDVDGATQRIAIGPIGFRDLELEQGDGAFQLRVNGTRIFARGACWTPLDVAGFSTDPQRLARDFALVRDAGINMLRLSGAMTYESDAFLDACDAQGVLVWQDLMFANMDYPAEDADFAALVEREVSEQLRRLQGRPSVAVICGNSEGSQQAAMWGAPQERWTPALFHETLPPRVAELLPTAVYWPSSAHGGAFPHQPSAGTASYFGVGAYRRPMSDARESGLRFASECLGFANIPEAEALAAMHPMVPGDATWKSGVPRDLGASWDFDHIRDHYVSSLFGVDASALRADEPDRYLELGRATTCYVIERTLRDLRRHGSAASGALVWFWRDLVPGIGWGVVDAGGRPKSAWYGLRRASAPLAVHLTDEGLNGLGISAINDGAEAFEGKLEVTLWKDGAVRVGLGTSPVSVPAHGSLSRNVVDVLGDFLDVNHAYRFGPPVADLVAVRLLDADGQERAQDRFVVGLLPRDVDPALRISASLGRAANDGHWRLTVEANRVALFVHSALPGYRLEDEYFCLLPGETREIIAIPLEGTKSAPAGEIRAVNLARSAPVTAA